MLLVLLLVVGIAALLYATNSFLRGANKIQITMFLKLVMFGAVAVAFYTGGWRHGVLLTLCSLLAPSLFRPIGARIAGRVFSNARPGTGRHIGLPPRPLRSIESELGRELDPARMLEELRSPQPSRSDRAQNALLDYCEFNPATRHIVESLGRVRQRLAEIYSTLVRQGAGQWAGGHWVAASAIAYPEPLEFLLKHDLQDDDAMSYVVYSLVDYFERGVELIPYPGLRST